MGGGARHGQTAEAIWQAARTAVRDGGHLPAATYTEADFHDFERDALFHRTWVLAGCASEIPKDGDAMPVTFAERSLILLRDKGDVRVLSNVCRHRGACLLTDRCEGATVFTCPYHAWSYGLDGALRSRPHFHGDGRHDTSGDPDIRLETVRSALWNDLIFVNIDGNAPPLVDFLSPITEHFEGWDFSQMRFGGALDMEAPGNWKLVAENYLDNYHIFALHPSIDAAFPQRLRRPARLTRKPFILGKYTADPVEQNYMAPLPANPNIASQLEREVAFFSIFPNVLMHVWPYCVMVMQLVPEDTDRTRQRYFFYFYSPTPELTGDPTPRDEAVESYREINQDQDFPIIVNMQRARETGAFDQGALSPFWDSMITDFARTYVETIEQSA